MSALELPSGPAAAEEEPPSVNMDQPHPGTAKCRFCPETFPLTRGSWLSQGHHEKKEHPEEYKAAEDAGDPKSGKTPRKARGVTKKAPPRGGKDAPPSRQSAEHPIEMVINGLGTLMVRLAPRFHPALEPMGRMIAFESPIAGPEIDKAAADTYVDRLALQPAVGAQDRLTAVGPLIVAPLIVGALAMNPALDPELRPMLRAALIPMLPQMVAKMKRDQAKAEALAAAAAELAEMDPDFAAMFADGADPIDAILERLFPPPVES